jgi:hypothetical protein
MPETEEQKARRLARWYHGGAIGAVEFARSALHRVIALPHLSNETKNLAIEAQSLLTELRNRLQSEFPK